MREVGNFDFIVNQNTPNTIQIIWDSSIALSEIITAIDPREHYTVSTFLESLRLDVYLPSFNKAGFPEIYPEMSAAEKAVKMMEVEAASPKTGLAFYRKKTTETDWHYLSEIVLQNRGRRTQIPVIVPHLTTNQLKIFSRNTQLGVQKIDYGNGRIGNGPLTANRDLDQIQIEGDFRIDIDQSEFKRNRRISIQDFINLTTTIETVLYQNPSRAYFELQNNSSRKIFITFGTLSSTLQALILEPGKTYYPLGDHVLTENIRARAESGEANLRYWEMEYY